MSRLLSAMLVWLFVFLWNASAQAHYLDIAQFSFYQGESEDNFRLVVDNLPQNLTPDQPVDWPAGCSVLDRVESRIGDSPRVAFEVNCETASDGLIRTSWGSAGGLLEMNYSDGRTTSSTLSGSSGGAAIELPDWDADEVGEAAGFWQTAAHYLEMGTEHVLIGWDHLAFVFCLGMLASGMALIWLISAFTVGHSLSLALAHLGIVNVPIAPVEAIIALSVVFMAREALLLRLGPVARTDSGGSGSFPPIKRLNVTVAFGLIHGLGFASVLGGLGVSPAQTVTALVFFNIGVEIGQILFVLAILAIFVLIRRVRMDQPVARAAISGVGAVAIFWTVERVVGM